MPLATSAFHGHRGTSAAVVIRQACLLQAGQRTGCQQQEKDSCTFITLSHALSICDLPSVKLPFA